MRWTVQILTFILLIFSFSSTLVYSAPFKIILQKGALMVQDGDEFEIVEKGNELDSLKTYKIQSQPSDETAYSILSSPKIRK